MWSCQCIDLAKFETRPSSPRNFGMAYRGFTKQDTILASIYAKFERIEMKIDLKKSVKLSIYQHVNLNVIRRKERH